MEISETGDFMRLIISGEMPAADAYEIWETIIRRNARLNGSSAADNYLSEYKLYAKYLATYIIVRADLMILLHEVDDDRIEYLRSKGYYIKTSGARAYEKSITDNLAKVENLVSKMQSKAKALEKYGKEQGPSPSFEEIMAALCAGLGFQVTDDIKLARYNQYMKLMKDRERKSRSREQYDN